MKVAMIAVRMMKVPVDEVVHVVAVRDGGVAAAGGVDMRGIVAAAPVVGGALGRMAGRDGEDMLDDRAVGLMMEVPVVEVVEMAVMLDGGVAAAGAVRVVVMRVGDRGRHGGSGGEWGGGVRGHANSSAWCRMVSMSASTCASATR